MVFKFYFQIESTIGNEACCPAARVIGKENSTLKRLGECNRFQDSNVAATFLKLHCERKVKNCSCFLSYVFLYVLIITFFFLFLTTSMLQFDLNGKFARFVCPLFLYFFFAIHFDNSICLFVPRKRKSSGG